MSTTTLSAPIRVNTAGVHARPGLGRLVAVELRKMVDTRAGFWLQVAMVALTVVVVVVRLLVGDCGGPHVPVRPRRRAAAGGRPAAGPRHPARHLRVVPAHRADHVRARPGALARPRRQAHREPPARRRDAGDLRRRRRRRGARLVARRRRDLVRRRAADRPVGRLPDGRDGRWRRARRDPARLRARHRPPLRAADVVDGGRSRCPCSPASPRGWTTRAPSAR